MIQKPETHSLVSTNGPSVTSRLGAVRPSTTVAVAGAPETGREDPVAVRLELVVEDVDVGHLVRGSGLGPVVDHGNQILHGNHSPGSRNAPRGRVLTRATNASAPIRHRDLTFLDGPAPCDVPRVWGMTLQRMDNVAIVVDDLAAAVAFFTELGMEQEGGGLIEGSFADQTVGLDGVRSEIAMMRTPDGHSKLELTTYLSPVASAPDPASPPPTRWACTASCSPSTTSTTRSPACAPIGAELLGEIARYEDLFRLCYLRGPAGIIVALAEQVG